MIRISIIILSFFAVLVTYAQCDIESYIVDVEVPTEIRDLAGEIIEPAYKPEGIEDIHEDSDQPVKFLHNGQILILRGDRTYTLTGAEVK